MLGLDAVLEEALVPQLSEVEVWVCFLRLVSDVRVLHVGALELGQAQQQHGRPARRRVRVICAQGTYQC
jgi:hypothetical protein